MRAYCSKEGPSLELRAEGLLIIRIEVRNNRPSFKTTADLFETSARHSKRLPVIRNKCPSFKMTACHPKQSPVIQNDCQSFETTARLSKRQTVIQNDRPSFELMARLSNRGHSNQFEWPRFNNFDSITWCGQVTTSPPPPQITGSFLQGIHSATGRLSRPSLWLCTHTVVNPRTPSNTRINGTTGRLSLPSLRPCPHASNIRWKWLTRERDG